MPTPTHRAFSFLRLGAIAQNTLLELVRLKVFHFMLLFALLQIGSSAVVVNFTFQEQWQVLKDVALGAMAIFTWLLATLSTAMLLPKDVEDRTLYTILAKPVPRVEYLLGKLLGVLLMLAIALALMAALLAAVLYARQQLAFGEAAQHFPDAELAVERARISAAAWNFNLLPGIAIIYLKAAVVAALTLLLSTFSSSWLFTVIISVVVYFIGHVQHIAREYWLDPAAQANAGPLLKIFLGLVSLVFPDFQLFNIVDDIAVGNAVPADLFWKTGALGCGYVAIYTLVAYVIFAKKEL